MQNDIAHFTILYSETVFMMIEPPCRIISVHRVQDQKSHKDLIIKAKQKGLYLYRANVRNRNGKIFAIQPWLIEWDTVKEQQQETRSVEVEVVKEQLPDKVEDDKPTDSFICPHCSKKMSSSSGLTLHIKSKHHETSDDDIVDRVEENKQAVENKQDGLQCPFCDKVTTSTPGRTLHVKNRHPERLEEYMRLIRG